MTDDDAAILVVDDKPEAILAIEVALGTLGQHVVRAGSGREALRHVLAQPFALMLLDVNMPDMNGFETAELIRRHRHAKDTPIIFLTGSSDDLHEHRGYSLGAVDFIVKPVHEDVLRTKVAVFVEQYRATERARQQAQRLQARATQIHRLTRASLRVSTAGTVDGIARALTEEARDVIGTHQALTMLWFPSAAAMRSGPDRRALTVVSLSDKHAELREQSLEAPPGLAAFARERNAPFRRSERELAENGDWTRTAGGMLHLRGCLVAPLVDVDGRNMGFVLLSDRMHGELSDDDEAILVQLAQLASVAVQNAFLIASREAHRLEEDLLATLSHELRTPLSAILGWTRMMRATAPSPEKLARGLEVIERNVDAQTRLIEELLDVSRIASGKLLVERHPMLLVPIVQTAVDAVRPSAEARGLTLHVTLAGDVPRISGDPDRLQQVISNLLSNAVKFTPRGGRIAIHLAAQEGMLELRVSDTGIGLRADHLPFVFDRFWQAEGGSRRQHGGLGIGLALVRHLIELHDGVVRVESAGEGLGTTFTVRIPTMPEAEARDAAPPTARSALGTPDLAGVRVLLVEDEVDSRELLRETLEQHRARVTAVGSVGEAIVALGSSRPHVLVSDIAMPGADGYDLIRHLRSRHAAEGGDIPALALTAYTRSEDRARTLAAGFQMHASKPFEPLDIVSAVAQLAASTRPVHVDGAW
ncbi:two-component sensor histidine kinase [Minicystis rosea]|nr:two-component sensor histidine kinase [Minicystis rosea]